jgi:hypothetical protein
LSRYYQSSYAKQIFTIMAESARGVNGEDLPCAEIEEKNIGKS